MKMCNENWSIRVDWPLKHVNDGTRKVKTKANISAKFALFFVSNCKTNKVGIKSESLSSGII